MVAIAGGLGGAINGAFHVTCDAYVFHNIFALAMQTYSPFAGYLAGITAALAAGLVLTYFWGITENDKADFEVAVPDGQKDGGKNVAQETAKSGKSGQVMEIHSPLSGEVMELKDVPDEVFASGVAGQGIAVNPSAGEVKAPCNGVVSVLFPSKHAIGIAAEDGTERLIHVGLNTVMLDGAGFEALVEQGDKVREGQPLLRFDMDFIRKQGYSLVSPILVTNADDFQQIRLLGKKQVEAGEAVYEVIG